MDSRIGAAIISIFLPGIGQAATTGKPTGKWIAVWLIYIVIYNILRMTVGDTIGLIFGLIVVIVLAYDAYADKIDLDSLI